MSKWVLLLDVGAEDACRQINHDENRHRTHQHDRAEHKQAARVLAFAEPFDERSIIKLPVLLANLDDVEGDGEILE